jgi:predicted RNA binding protein with dsRBD fold (UPF0201 family)
MKITITAPVNATEDGDKILKGLERVFPKVKFKSTKKEISGISSDKTALNNVRDKIIAKKIKNTARYLILEYQNDKGARVMFNKQAIVVGKVNFVEEEYPLGNVIMDVETDNIEGLADYITGLI